MTQRPRLLSIGTAVPDATMSQESAAEHALSIEAAQEPEDRRSRALRALYRRSGVHSRGSVLSASGYDLATFFRAELPKGPSTADRMEIYAAHAGDLANQAASAALEQSSIDPSRITHIVTVSCTGFAAPGVDQSLMRRLGIPVSARRTNIGFMGCHAAINALAAASAFVSLDPENRVLVVCVELCSLHFSYADDADRRVANALFADGAAAAIIGTDEQHGDDAPAIAGFGSMLIPHTEDLMGWRIGDHGFEMNLSPAVPGVLAEAVPDWLGALIGRHDLTIADIHGWAIHPGGPRLLAAVTGSLGLPPTADRESRAVLAEHGNMSSATVLFIIERLLHERTARNPSLPILAAAFGPGLAGEAMLLV